MPLSWTSTRRRCPTSALADELAGRARETCGPLTARCSRAAHRVLNVCKNDCYYCGIRRSNRACERYRLAPEQILACADAGWQAASAPSCCRAGKIRRPPTNGWPAW